MKALKRFWMRFWYPGICFKHRKEKTRVWRSWHCSECANERLRLREAKIAAAVERYYR